MENELICVACVLTSDPRHPPRLVPPERRVTGDDGEIKEEETSESIKLPGETTRGACRRGRRSCRRCRYCLRPVCARFGRLYLGFVVCFEF
ncbi:hypothetical protein EYF80_028554 [Liparis tanakae]|uniref:Uncharacterized protein n=1 Tax=Liparis tanakae TaxID=230148 RepID=A0A4Z2H631_9TELE|nr:hypothetical protein EYF80_028554 [Liparis tanakae]